MENEYNSEYQRLIKYVDAACTLADACTIDVKKGKYKAMYSDETILALSKFIAEHNSFNKLVDQVRAKGVQLN